jgi:hypothetical protein
MQGRMQAVEKKPKKTLQGLMMVKKKMEEEENATGRDDILEAGQTFTFDSRAKLQLKRQNHMASFVLAPFILPCSRRQPDSLCANNIIAHP